MRAKRKRRESEDPETIEVLEGSVRPVVSVLCGFERRCPVNTRSPISHLTHPAMLLLLQGRGRRTLHTGRPGDLPLPAVPAGRPLTSLPAPVRRLCSGVCPAGEGEKERVVTLPLLLILTTSPQITVVLRAACLEGSERPSRPGGQAARHPHRRLRSVRRHHGPLPGQARLGRERRPVRQD